MLTTTVDGLWVLQVLTGIEVVAPELALRPHLPSVEPKRLALAHPITAELRTAGVLDAADVVDNTVVEWLTVLSRRDIALLVHIQTPNGVAQHEEPARALLARFAQWWVAMERCEDLIRISGAGMAGAEDTAGAVLEAQIERLCGANTPVALRPVTLDAEAMRAAAASQDSLEEFLDRQKLDRDQLRILRLAADPRRSAQAAMVAIQSGTQAGLSGLNHIEDSAVAIIDTPEGRLVVENVHSATSADKKWLIVSPGNTGNIAAAINALVRRLPAEKEWYSYRRVV